LYGDREGKRLNEGRMEEEKKGREVRKAGREGGVIYTFYLKLLLDCRQKEKQEC